MSNGSETSVSYRLCQFSTLDNGIVEVTFASSSIAAVDQFYLQLDQLMKNPTKIPVLLLVNITQAPTLPVIYISRQARRFANAHRGEPPVKTAIIARATSGLLMREITQFLSSVFLDPRTLVMFDEDQYDSAIVWLLETNRPD